MKSSLTHVRAYISGRVQGVGYRYSTAREAERLAISGWVRNLPDGRVEAVFEGVPEVVEQMLDWCHRGPAGAAVENVTIENRAHQGLQGFEIRR
ncbi:MAG: acylphosphatase [Cyanobacteriota bacterium]|nr:acylphosphatase [Cyanobacteriota bacterium]